MLTVLRRARRHPLALLLIFAVAVYGQAVPEPTTALAAGPEPIRYAYDDAGRLVGVTDPAGDTATYAYDPAGNLTGITRRPSSQLAVLSVTPSQGAAGAQVTVAGTGFDPDAADNTVTFNGAAATVTSASATQLVVTVPAGAATGTVQVATAAGTATSPRPFTVTPGAPTIAGFSPASGSPGTTVTITGAGFDPDPARNSMVFNQATRAEVTAASATSLTVKVPAAGAGKVTVRTAAGTATSAAEFDVPPGAYALTDVASTTRIAIGGANATANVSAGGKIALLRFDGAKGQRLSLAFSGKTISGNLTVHLYQPNGVEFSGDPFTRPFAVPGNTSLELPPLPATGTYQVAVDPDGSGTGTVVATLSEDIDAGALDPAGAGTAVSAPRAGQGSLLRFSGTAGQRLGIGLTGYTFTSGAAITVFRPDDPSLTFAKLTVSASSSVMTLQPLPETGTYEVLLTPTAAGTGAATVTLSPELDGGTLSTTAPGTDVAIGRPGQSARLRFDGTAGQRGLGLGLTGTWFTGSTWVNVIAPDGTQMFVIAQRLADNNALDIPDLPATGTYEVVVDPISTRTGTATLTLSTELDAGVVTSTESGVLVTVPRPGQNARLRFDATAGQRGLGLGFTEGTFGSSLFSGSHRVTIFKPDGTSLTSPMLNGAAGDVDLPVLPLTGTYELLVDPQIARTGAVRVTLSTEVDGGAVTATGPGVLVSVTRPGQDARARFDGTAGQRLGIGAIGSTFGGAFALTVMKPDGTSLVSQTLSGTAVDVDLPVLPATGTYEVLLDPSAARIGGVTLTLSAAVDSGAVTVGGAGVLVSVARSGQDALLRFDGAAGQRLSLAGTNPTFGGSYTVSVTKPDGTSLSSRTLSGAAADDDLPVLPVTGTYEVLIDPSVARIGAVTLLLSAEVDAGVVTVGGAGVVAAFGRTGQNARLRFTGTAAQRLTLALSATSYSGFTAVSVLKPDGTTLLGSRNLPGTGSAVLAALPVAGTYEILADPVTAQTGSTTVALTVTPSAAVVAARRAGAATRSVAGPPAAPVKPTLPRVPAEDALGAATAAAPAGAGALDAAIEAAHGWAPDEWHLAGMDWSTRALAPGSRPGQASPRRAARGVTALAGRVRALNGDPLAGVRVAIDGIAGRTDRAGRFLLAGLPAGHHELVVDGDRAGRLGRDYGTYEIGVDVAAGRTTVLPYTIWLTRIDPDHTVRFPSPTTGEVVVTTPRVPGLEVHLPAGSVVKDMDGKVVRELGITAIPVDRPPFPMPGDVRFPIYFTVQPGGAYVFPEGARIIYPNYTDLAPRTRVEFWNYDPDGRGWHLYGHGSVTADGRQVVPDPGVRVYEFTGTSFNTPGLEGPDAGPGFDLMDWLGGDPVDLGTGLFVDTHTDLFLPDVMPISITRTYRQADGATRPFGLGANFNYGIFLHSQTPFQEADLVMPDGGKIHYERTTVGDSFDDMEFLNTTSPTEWYLSKLYWNGNGWNLRRRDGMTWVFGYTTPLQAIRDRHGNQVTLTRTGAGGNSQAGDVTRITSPNGKWISLTYDAGHRITQAQDSIGRTVGYHYDSHGRLDSVTDTAGKVTTYGWNGDDQIETVTDPRGITFVSNEYDAFERVSRQTLAEGAVFEFAYTLDGDRVISTRVTDPRGHDRLVQFNDDGFATSDTAALGTAKEQTTTFLRNPGTNWIVSSVDPSGRETSFLHDNSGNVTEVTFLNGTAEAVTSRTVYGGPFNQVTEIGDGLQHSTHFAYDTNGNLATVTDPEGLTTSVAHTAEGQIASTTDERGKTTSMRYELGDLVATTDPLGRTTTHVTDPAGRVLETRSPNGATTTFAYNTRNEVTSVTDPLGGVTRFTYDDNGNLLTREDPGGAIWRSAYDDADQVETTTDPLGATTSYAYDLGGNLERSTSRGGIVTTYAYDELDRRVSGAYGVSGGSSESSVAFTYDAADRLTRIDDSAGGTITQVFDGLDRLTEQATPQGTISYTYDAANRRTSMRVAGQPEVAYAYDRADRPTTITKADQTVSYAYDEFGRFDSLTLPTGVTQAYDYDDAGQLTGITYQRGATVLGDLTYTYDLVGQRVTTGGSYARPDLPEAMSGAVYNDADQLTSLGPTSYTYDPDGNLTSDGTSTYTWNARGQLTAISGGGVSASFAHDTLGRRVARTVDGVTVGYLYDGDTAVQELDGTTPSANLLAGGTDAYYARTDATGTSSILTDVLGSTVGLAGASGGPATEYTYEPFGTTTAVGAPSANPSQFTGRENDGTGLYYHRARYYHPGLQRFISQDPTGHAGGANLYAYASNSPTNLTDPSGTHPLLFLAAIFLQGALISGFMSWGMQRLSGRKVSWSQVAFDAFIGGALNIITAGMGAGIAAAGRAASFTDDAVRAARACSFAPDTPVLMADGTTKPIDQVREGDKVLATDLSTGANAPRAVTATHSHDHDDRLDLTIATDGGEGTLHTTEGHRVWNDTDDTWSPAADLDSGDSLRTPDGEPASVVRATPVGGHGTMLDITVDRDHTFYVGAGDGFVLVHNAHLCTWQLRSSNGQFKWAGLKQSGSGMKFGRRPTWTEQAAAHTEPNILDDILELDEAGKLVLEPGDIITMQGQLPPCSPGGAGRGCQGVMQRFVDRYWGVKIIYRQQGVATPWVYGN